MSRSTFTIVVVLVWALLGSSAGLVTASLTTPDVPDQTAMIAATNAPQPVILDGDDYDVSVKFEGRVESDHRTDGTGTLVVASNGTDVTVEVTAGTEIGNGPIAVDDWVEVEGWLQPDGSVIAEKIEVKDHGDEGECSEIEFYGQLAAFDGTNPGDTWTIAIDGVGHQVLIDENTEIEGDPEIGALIEVEACRQAVGTLLALELDVHHNGDDEHDFPVEFRATIKEPLPPSPWIGVWHVGDWLVDVTSTTAIVGIPQVGRVAEVHGTHAPAGSGVDVIASKIEVEGRDHPGPAVEVVKIEGAITAIGAPDPLTGAEEWAIEGIPVIKDNTTLVDDHRIPAAVGVWAEASAIVQRNGSVVTYQAIRIETEFEDEPPGEVHFKGTFEGAVPSENGIAGDEDWTVSGQKFIVPSAVLPSLTPVAGDLVKIEAVHQADGTYVAFEVEIEGEDHD